MSNKSKEWNTQKYVCLLLRVGEDKGVGRYARSHGEQRIRIIKKNHPYTMLSFGVILCKNWNTFYYSNTYVNVKTLFK